MVATDSVSTLLIPTDLRSTVYAGTPLVALPSVRDSYYLFCFGTGHYLYPSSVNGRSKENVFRRPEVDLVNDRKAEVATPGNTDFFEFRCVKHRFSRGETDV